MPWNILTPWTTGELLTATKLNDLKENVDYAHSGKALQIVRATAGTRYQTISGAMAAIDAGFLKAEVNVTTGRVMLIFTGRFSSNALVKQLTLDFTANGTPLTPPASYKEILSLDNGTTVTDRMMTFIQVAQVAPNTNLTFLPRWSVGGGGPAYLEKEDTLSFTVIEL